MSFLYRVLDDRHLDAIPFKLVDNNDGTAILVVRDDGPSENWERKRVSTGNMKRPMDITDAPPADHTVVLADLTISVEEEMNVRIQEEISGVLLAGPYYLMAGGLVQRNSHRIVKAPTPGRKLQAVASRVSNITVETAWFTEP